MITTPAIPSHVRRACELVKDCLRDAAPGAEVSVELSPPTKGWGESMRATFTFTAPGEKPLKYSGEFSGDQGWWPDHGEFLGGTLWLGARHAFSDSPAWLAPKEGGPMPKCLRPGGEMRSVR